MFMGLTIDECFDAVFAAENMQQVSEFVDAVDELGFDIVPSRPSAAQHKANLQLRAKHEAAETHPAFCKCFHCMGVK